MTQGCLFSLQFFFNQILTGIRPKRYAFESIIRPVPQSPFTDPLYSLWRSSRARMEIKPPGIYWRGGRVCICSRARRFSKRKRKQSLRTGYVLLIGRIMVYCGDIPRRLAMDGNPSLSLIHQSLQATVIEVHLGKRQASADINSYTFEWKNGGSESVTRILFSQPEEN